MFSSTAVRTSDLTIPVARLVRKWLDRITGFGLSGLDKQFGLVLEKIPFNV
jgi:hypothetical protein